MIDINLLRKNPDIYKQAAANKACKVDIDLILSFDPKIKELDIQVQALRTRRNELGELGRTNPDAARVEGKKIKDELAGLEASTAELKSKQLAALQKVPNLPLEGVPVGDSEEQNVVVKTWGTKREFTFEPRTHWELAQKLGLIDKERATKVTGTRFAYLKGRLAVLQMAIVNYVFATLSNPDIIAKIITDRGLALDPKPFIPLLPPAMIKTEAFAAMDRLEPREERYSVGETADNLWLQGSAEHTMGAMYWQETLPAAELPIRYIGYLTSFRREAGTYGRDTEGIFRMHQFDKLEMETFSTGATGEAEHKLMVAIQEHLMQSLELPYQLLQKCTYDIGKPNASGYDLNAWMPGAGAYRETHTADYMTDYQARRLQTRVKLKDGATELVHTNDATAFALGRTLIAIMENYQTESGSIEVPQVLQKYTGFAEIK